MIHYLPVHYTDRKTVEDIIDAVGGHFSKGVPFALHTCKDGRVITAQNTASTEVFVHQMLELVEQHLVSNMML